MTAAGSAVVAVVDHLVVAADSLAQGVAWCEATLGVTPGPGGRHALFGTHNRLLKIATPDFADAYLEIIAIDSDAPPPRRPRWFGLDAPALQQQLRQAPRLLHLVARTPALEAHRAALAATGADPGEAVAAERETPRGWLRWRITVRADGSLGAGGALPTLIQWQGAHPAATMPDSGVTLRALRLRGLPAAAQAVLGLPGVAVDPVATVPALTATLATPKGDVTLDAA